MNVKKAVFLGTAVLCLLFAACSWEETPEKDLAGDSITALNPKLVGLWQFKYGTNVEEIRLHWDEGLGKYTFTYGGNDWLSGEFREAFWAGTLEYVNNFTEGTGILIIKYLPGQKQVWMDWSLGIPQNPQPAGDYYGIYFINLR